MAKKKTERRAKAGQPAIECTDKIAKEICNAIAESSLGLKKLCALNPQWPGERTIREWIKSNTKFSQLYAQAKLNQADVLVEECLEIADDSTHDTLTKTDSHGESYEVCNNEWVNRSRLRVDTRKWVAVKLSPRVYGDKIQTETTRVLKTIDDIIELYKSFNETDRLALIDRLSQVESVKEEAQV